MTTGRPAQHDLAIADVAAAEADLLLTEINLAKATIRSPIDGVVLKRGVDPGQFVATSLQAPVLFVIAEDLRRMEVLVDVDEADVGKVKIGQKVTFSVDAYPDRKFPAGCGTSGSDPRSYRVLSPIRLCLRSKTPNS
jgi:HlyD family secretion protein